MPQEMNVLRCYSCEMFQVHIVKKATKWQCKVCNEKQSIQHVYYQGSGSECRLQVQHLNLTKQTTQQQELKALELIATTDNAASKTCQSIKCPTNNSNKWAKYVSGPPNSHHEIGPGVDNEEGSFLSTNVELQSESELNQSDNYGIDGTSTIEFVGHQSSKSGIIYHQHQKNNGETDLDTGKENMYSESSPDIPIKKRPKIELDSAKNTLLLKSLGSTKNVSNREFKRIKYTTDNESTSQAQSLRDIVKINRFEATKSVENNAVAIPKLMSSQRDTNRSVTAPKVIDLVAKKKSIFESNCDDFDDILDF